MGMHLDSNGMNDNEASLLTLSTFDTAHDCWWFWSVVRGCILVAVLVGLFTWFVMPVVLRMMYPFGMDDGPRPPDPPKDFHSLTGWDLPADAEVLFAENTASGFRGDGHYALVIQTLPETVTDWVSATGAHTWKPLPLPFEIKRYCLELPDHDGALYRARKYSDTDADWHRGTLLIVNPDSGTVVVYAWKH